MVRSLITLAFAGAAIAFTPLTGPRRLRSRARTAISAKLGVDESVLVVGVAADSGCGKSTFMRRLTGMFGGSKVGPLGGGFDNGGWETNTLCSDTTTVICLDDYHLNDRGGRKVSGKTALNVVEQNFDLMAEQIAALKRGESVKKPIYNHVNGTLDTPEEIVPTKIVIIEGACFCSFWLFCRSACARLRGCCVVGCYVPACAPACLLLLVVLSFRRALLRVCCCHVFCLSFRRALHPRSPPPLLFKASTRSWTRA